MKEYTYKINGEQYNVTINEVAETTAKVTVNGNEYEVEWEKPEEKKPAVVAKPVVKPAPALGEHTDEVLKEIGYTPEEITALRQKHIVCK